MSARVRLESYLDHLRRRLRTLIVSRTAAVLAPTLLVVTTAAVWWLQKEGYPAHIAWIGRGVLLVAALAIVSLLLWRPLRNLRRDAGAHEFERLLPEQQGRIRTYLDGVRREREGVRSPLLDLLAEDAADRTEHTAPSQVVPQAHIVAAFAIAGLAVVALIGLASFGPAYWGYGSRYLLFGADVPRAAIPVRRIVVQPGDATVRKNSDFVVTADIEGFEPDEAFLYVRFADEEQWERAPMQIGEQGQWQFKLFALRAPLQYYVAADAVRSPDHNVAVLDLPRIQSVRLTYEYPEWTGLEPMIDEESRDIRAVEGTRVKLEVVADGPLESPALIVDGVAGEMQVEGAVTSGVIEVMQEGRYHIGAKVANEFVALTDDYYIDIVADEKPTIEIVKPGRDWRATSIEEVPVLIEARDDFRLQRVELRYSVNGGEWQTLPVDGNRKEARSESLLRLEELGSAKAAVDAVQQRLEPGDLVSYYAVARDRKQTVQTDLFMVQVQPFERRFSQGQAGGGMGGAPGDEQGEISEQQKEILLATWNLQRSDERNSRSRKQLQDNAKMLAEMQTTLAQQARTLAQRMRARVSLDADASMKQFVESMEKAASLMDPAAQHLGDFKLAAAVPVEQQALQQVLRAEAAFRDVQVAMQQQGGGMGGAQSARNLSEMFELEMDLNKSQYETESQVSMENAQEEMSDAIRKLKQLAERQEKLAQEANRATMSMEEQRWRQEQLRREAEDLKRRLEELARNERNAQNAQANSRSASNQGSQSQGSQSQGSESSESSGAQSGSASGSSAGERREQTRVANAVESLQRALEQMRGVPPNRQSGQLGQQGQPGQESASSEPQTNLNAANTGETQREADVRAAREASRNLQRALEQIDRPGPQGGGLAEALESFAERTRALAEEQRDIEADLNEAIAAAQRSGMRGSERGAIDPRRAQQLVEAKQRMADEVSELQSGLRAAAQEHRRQTPDGAQRLSEAISELDASNIMHRLNRSAAEIYYNRAREAAAREGLITEALENLEANLRETAIVAARERKNAEEGVAPDQLLAQLGELRRAVQDAQNRQAAAQRGEGTAGEPTDQLSSQAVEGEGGTASSSAQSPSNAQANSRSAGEGTNGGAGWGGLRAWNPNTQVGPLRPASPGAFDRETRELGELVQGFANRLDSRNLSATEVDQLRRLANQLRRLTGDPMSAQPETMMRLIDQIELATLAAAAKSKSEVSPRTATPSPDSPQYRETVAEYYRRLGGGT